MLGAEILSYKEIHCKATQIAEENKLYPAKWKQPKQLG